MKLSKLLALLMKQVEFNCVLYDFSGESEESIVAEVASQSATSRFNRRRNTSVSEVINTL